ncbi:MAG: hypothetical protein ACHQF2_11720, partial [Flavobacteriales bacterium]
MKRFLLMLVCAVTMSSAAVAQEVVFEQEYTRNLTTPSDVITIPLKDGGMFLAYCKSPKVSPKPSQVLVAFDKEKKKLFEFATGDVVEFKNKKLNFLYNEGTQKIYGVYTYQKKGVSYADVMMLNMAGSYTAKLAIPTAMHVVHCFLYDNNLVLLGLHNENKPTGGNSKVPSGEFEATIVKGDVSSYSTQKLSLPSFVAEKGVVKNRVVDIDGSIIYFVTETKSEAITNKLSVSYEFTKYDFASHKAEASKTVSIEMEDNCERTSQVVFGNRADLITCEEIWEDFPHMVYNKTEKAFFVMGTYGKGYPAETASRKREGGFVVRINKSFGVEWKAMINATNEMLQMPEFSAAASKNTVGMHNIKDKTYFTIGSEADGKNVGT